MRGWRSVWKVFKISTSSDKCVKLIKFWKRLFGVFMWEGWRGGAKVKPVIASFQSFMKIYFRSDRRVRTLLMGHFQVRIVELLKAQRYYNPWKKSTWSSLPVRVKSSVSFLIAREEKSQASHKDFCWYSTCYGKYFTNLESAVVLNLFKKKSGTEQLPENFLLD